MGDILVVKFSGSIILIKYNGNIKHKIWNQNDKEDEGTKSYDTSSFILQMIF